MKSLFTSRGKARDYAAKNGLKVVDLGKEATPRWKVIPKEARKGMPQEATTLEKIAAVEEGLQHPVKIESQFFDSRSDARAFKGQVSGILIDHAKNKDSVVGDKGKQGKRWEVVYETAPAEVKDDVTTTKIETLSPEACSANVESDKVEPVVIMTLKNLQVTLPDGKNFVMSRSHEDFPQCAKLFAEGNIEALIVAIDVDKKPKEWSFGNDIKVIDGVLYHYGMEVNSSLAKRIVSDCENNIDPVKYVEFFRKLMKNPSFKAVKMVYDFIQHNDLEVMNNGDIKAWKMINANGYDYHTRKVPNFKGMTVQMPRNMVEDNPQVTCSAGLHVAAKEYFKHEFGSGYLIEVAVSPEDIVSVPVDYNNSKCRCCRYTVLTGKEKPEGVPDVIMVDDKGQAIKNFRPAVEDME